MVIQGKRMKILKNSTEWTIWPELLTGHRASRVEIVRNEQIRPQFVDKYLWHNT